METLDGAFVKVTTPVGVGISLYGGVPVEYSILDNAERGDSLYGGRVFFVTAGVRGDGRLVPEGERVVREARTASCTAATCGCASPRGWSSPARRRTTGTVREMASQRYAVRIVPGSTFDISAGYESYTYKGLFQSALNPAFVLPTVDNTDKVQTIFGIVDWEFAPGWTLEVAGKNIRHDRADPGDANRGEVGLRYAYNERKDMAGVSAAVVAADRDENEYQEYRGFATYSPAKLRLTLDAIAQQYKEERSGREEERVPGGRHRGVPAPRRAAALRQPHVHAEPESSRRITRG